MQILEFPSAAAVVNIKDKIVDFYLVLTGKVMIESPGKKTVIRNNFELFGSTAPLRDEEYERFSVTTLEHSFIIRVPREKFLKIIDQFHLFLEKKRTVNFMGKSIPGGQLISESGKLNLLSLFTNAEFVSGEVLLKDGEVSEYAYIIREGECRLVCSNTSINQKWGFISHTTSSYNYGIVTPGEWAGEASILLNKPMEYSVIAKTAVRALKISAHNLSTGFPNVVLKMLRENAEKKQVWYATRRDQIDKTLVKAVYSEGQADFNKSLEYTEKDFPKANRKVISNIRRLELVKKSHNPRALNFSPKIRNQSPLLLSQKELAQDVTLRFSNTKSMQQLILEPCEEPKTRLQSGSFYSSKLVPTYSPSYKNRSPSERRFSFSPVKLRKSLKLFPDISTPTNISEIRDSKFVLRLRRGSKPTLEETN